MSESQTYQKMLEEVEKIIHDVGGQGLDLDQVVAKVERGFQLIQDMRSRLDHTKMQVEQIRTKYETGAGATPT